MGKSKAHKFVFVVGGVMSGVGKGVASSSIGTLLSSRGYKVTALKIDPYINVDAGTMNPTEHGEVFVLEDGLETDQDMGNYERFLGLTLSRTNYMTTGSVYLEVIKKERALHYKGRNVEVVPDIPLEVIDRIERAAKLADADITLIEIGGTVGEYQNILFLEAARMMKSKYPDGVAVVMVSYLPVPGSIGEMKTKPTQYAVRTLNSAGVFADIILARAPVVIDQKRKEKIATFCNVRPEHVISAPDVASIYQVPLNFEKEKLSEKLLHILNLPTTAEPDLKAWKSLVKKIESPKRELRLAVVGKYFASGSFVLSDAYVSVIEALKYASFHAGAKPVLEWIDAEEFEKDKKALSRLSRFDGIVVPGGFGTRGIEGIIKVIEYARNKKIPYFGLCYGMQLLVVEYARNVAKLERAHTVEVDPGTPHPVVDIMPEQRKKLAQGDFGGSMRLGTFPAYLKEGTVARSAYKAEMVHERHRHRYEVNPSYIQPLEDAGLIFSGISPDKKLMEIAELPKSVHPFFLGTQFHPEFLARPLTSHPLFDRFVSIALKRPHGK